MRTSKGEMGSLSLVGQFRAGLLMLDNRVYKCQTCSDLKTLQTDHNDYHGSPFKGSNRYWNTVEMRYFSPALNQIIIIINNNNTLLVTITVCFCIIYKWHLQYSLHIPTYSISCYINGNYCLYWTTSARGKTYTLVSALRSQKAERKLPILGYNNINFILSPCSLLLVFWFKTMFRAKNSFSWISSKDMFSTTAISIIL